MATSSASNRYRYVPDPSTGGVVDTSTGLVIMPGDPGWNPAWSTTLASEQVGTPWQNQNEANTPGFWDLSDVPWWIKALSAGLLTGGVASALSPASAVGDAATAGAGTTGSTVPVVGALAPSLAPSGAVASGLSSALAPTVASTVAPTVTSTSSSWLTPGVVTGAISTGGQLAGALIQSNAVNDAAQIQANTAAQALAYQKEVDAYNRALAASHYGDYTGRIAPYVSSGVNAGARMSQLLGLPAPAPQTVGPAPPPLTPGGPTPTNTPITSGGTPPPTSQGQVLMRAPDGTTNYVNSADVPHYTQAGATVVGNA